MTKRIIYLAGPMKGYPDHNYPAFMAAAASLRSAGHHVYNPAEFPHDGPREEFPLRRAFAEYSRFICIEADTLVLLPGWEKSLGVSAELALAKNCGIEVIEFNAVMIGHPAAPDIRLGGIMAGRDLDPDDRFETALNLALGERIRASDDFAKAVWSALVNCIWTHSDGCSVSYSFRAAGDVVAAVRGSGCYMDWYCSGPYPICSDEIAEAMRALGWSWSRDDG